MNDLKVRVLGNTDVFEKAEDVQRSAWGIDDITIVPAHLLEAMSKYNAGLIIGAYFREQMVGFMLVLETRDKKVHHLHMIGVQSKLQGGGSGIHIGEALFRFYGQEASNRGVEKVQWTYDPLLGPNASLYFHKLGAESVCYISDAYGESSKVGIYQGLSTDRLLVSWQPNTFRDAPIERGSFPLITTVDEIGEAPKFALEIPNDINELEPDLATKARLNSRAIFTEAFSRGYKILDFVHEKETRRNFYIFYRNR